MNTSRPTLHGTPRRRHAHLESLESRTHFAAGALDPTYGTGGKIVGHANFDWQENLFSPRVVSAALAPDNSVYVVGNVQRTGDGPNDLVFVSRFKTDGTVDLAFGKDGMAAFDFGANGTVTSIALDRSNRILVAGIAGKKGRKQPALARLLPTGRLDNTFSGDGRVIVSSGFTATELRDIAIAPDGKVLFAGGATLAKGKSTAIVGRVSEDGSPDATFAGSGVRSVDIHAGNEVASAIAVRKGRIYISATVGETRNTSFAVAKLKSNGALDRSFDGNGIASVGNFYDRWADPDVLVAGDGSVYLAGSVVFDRPKNPTEDYYRPISYTVAKLTPLGKPDLTFNQTGLIRESSGSTQPGVSPKPVSLSATASGISVRTGSVGEMRLSATGQFEPLSSSTDLRNFESPSYDDEVVSVFRTGTSTFRLVLTGQYGSRSLTDDEVQVVSFDASKSQGQSLQVAPRQKGLIFINRSQDATIDLQGNLTVAGGSQFSFAAFQYKPNGNRNVSFAGNGRFLSDSLTDETFAANQIFTLGDGTLVLSGSGRAQSGDGITPLIIGVSSSGERVFRVGSEGTETSYGFVKHLPSGAISYEFTRDTDNTHYRGYYDPKTKLALEYQSLTPQYEYTGEGNWYLAPGIANVNTTAVLPISSNSEPVRSGTITFYNDNPDANRYDFIVEHRISSQFTNGSTDNAFGNGKGYVTTKSEPTLVATDNGKILYTLAGEGGVRRLNADGSADLSFGDRGIAASNFTNFMLDSKSRLVAWKQFKTGAAIGDIQVARFTRDGKADASFGKAGLTVIDGAFVGDTRLVVDANNDLFVSSLKQTDQTYDWIAAKVKGS